MPRRKTAVKIKHTPPSRSRPSDLITAGAVDLHFHGAFGIDLMTAEARELTRLAELLWQQGVAAFCPTTLSVGAPSLVRSVERLGSWIRGLPSDYRRSGTGALPLGLHLEGPFISPEARGAHPPGAVRPLRFEELTSLWEVSQGTIKILTLAPEKLKRSELARLCEWAEKRDVILSLGHSQATELQAKAAFDAGFRGVTHAWNALGFHHRAPGALGAAIGRKEVYLELIPDGVHVDPTVIRWTRQLHSRVCFVSDCAPAAATADGWHAFGPLKTRFKKGACRLPDGNLAGGGLLLPEAFGRWLAQEARNRDVPSLSLLRQSVEAVAANPLKALRLSPSLLKFRQVRWKVASDGIFRPFPNKSR